MVDRVNRVGAMLQYASVKLTTPATAVSTHAVVHSCVLFRDADTVGAVGVPVSAGDASGA